MVEFEIAHMDDQTGRRGNPQANRIGDGVANVEQFDLERTKLEALACLHCMERSLAENIVPCQFGLDQAAGQGSGVDRGRDIVQYMTDSTDMVFMPMRDDNSHHTVSFVQ